MPLSRRIPIVIALTAIVITLTAISLRGQTFDPTLTDPDAIAMECGGDALAGLPHYESKCADCHALTPEAQQTTAPHLAGLYGRPAASLAGVSYSPQLSEMFHIWEGETLHQLLAGEMSIPNHPVMMVEQDRRDLLTYLRTETRPAPPKFEDIRVPTHLLTMEGDPAYGEYLASECASCHNAGAVSQGTPDLAGRPREDFLHLMVAYRQRALPNPIMQMTAAKFSDEELAALAEWFATQKPPNEGG